MDTVEELIQVLDRWNIPPDVWLDQDSRIRHDIWKYLNLQTDAELYVDPPKDQPKRELPGEEDNAPPPLSHGFYDAQDL